MRRGPAWDCGYPDPSPATQYTADELRPADPPRVRHRRVPRARDRRDAAARRQRARRGSTVELRDLIWDALYAPIAAGIGFAAERLNVLQFLTIRRYLTLVFAALVLLLLVLAIWP